MVIFNKIFKVDISICYKAKPKSFAVFQEIVESLKQSINYE